MTTAESLAAAEARLVAGITAARSCVRGVGRDALAELEGLKADTRDATAILADVARQAAAMLASLEALALDFAAPFLDAFPADACPTPPANPAPPQPVAVPDAYPFGMTDAERLAHEAEEYRRNEDMLADYPPMTAGEREALAELERAGAVASDADLLAEPMGAPAFSLPDGGEVLHADAAGTLRSHGLPLSREEALTMARDERKTLPRKPKKAKRRKTPGPGPSVNGEGR
jgi:hypothetical protein